MKRLVRVGVLSIAAMGLVASTQSAAVAGSHTGTKGCAGQYGYLKAITNGATKFGPPGSVYEYRFASGGTRTRVAATAGGLPVTGGGYWYVVADGSATGKPSCKNFA